MSSLEQLGAGLEHSARRIAADVALLAAPPYTSQAGVVRRYAFTDAYRATDAWFADRFAALGFACTHDPVGTFVARNRPPGVPVLALGSHFDSNRNGGAFDGTLGVVCAVELCRLAHGRGLDLPLQVVGFVEEEGSGFGEMLLGSRVAAGLVGDAELATTVLALDDGRPFAAHAREAGHDAADAARSGALDGLLAWVEIHIEQGRLLEDAGQSLGVVDAIAGYQQGDLRFDGRADHAGATPMDLRADALLGAAACALEAERLALGVGRSTVATVGELELAPGILNVVPSGARMSYDVRGPDDGAVARTVDGLVAHGRAQAAARGLGLAHQVRHRMAATPLDAGVVGLLEDAAGRAGAPWRRMTSGAAHDTMSIAGRVPSAMVFVPCRDGISHAPDEHADPHDAALATAVVLDALVARLAREGA